MIADYFTKPLQGILFYKLRDYIMNIDPSSDYHSGHRSVLGIDNPDVTIPEKEYLTDREVPEECVELPAAVMNNTRSYRDVLLNS
jgi:hypothetical protein